jgi:hypothetical protein
LTTTTTVRRLLNSLLLYQFLRTACRLARKAVYSFHKRSTRSFVLKLVQEWGYRATVAAEMAFDIPQTYQFHSEKTKDVEVDLIRVEIHADDEHQQELETEHDINLVDHDNCEESKMRF